MTVNRNRICKKQENIRSDLEKIKLEQTHTFKYLGMQINNKFGHRCAICRHSLPFFTFSLHSVRTFITVHFHLGLPLFLFPSGGATLFNFHLLNMTCAFSFWLIGRMPCHHNIISLMWWLDGRVISFRYISNKIGPTVEPCGTPERMFRRELILTLNEQFWRYELMRAIVLMGKFMRNSLRSSPSCQTLSKTFLGLEQRGRKIYVGSLRDWLQWWCGGVVGLCYVDGEIRIGLGLGQMVV